jgi:ElaB/YqjD/DUF883 family membrane-anchored ribosome-binding protein
MDSNENETTKQQKAGEPGNASATAQNILDHGTEIYEKAEQVVNDAYNKTAQVVADTYKQAKNYSTENLGKTILIALGIGVGLGFLLGASSRPSRTGRLAQPIVNALSNFAQEFLR